MARFREKSVVVEAVQRRWDNWSEMCHHANVGKFAEGKPEGCYVDANGRAPEDANGQLGLRIPSPEGTMLAIQNDWIIRNKEGELYPMEPDVFAATYEAAEGSIDYKTNFEPDMRKYPMLANVLDAQLYVRVRKELCDLLVEARADAVRYVSDVRLEELEKVRVEEREACAKLCEQHADTGDGELGFLGRHGDLPTMIRARRT